jgi:cold shock protein
MVRATFTGHKARADSELLPPHCKRRPDGSISARFKGKRHMATGTVKWFNSSKGFGFIQPEGGGKDVFVHITAVQAAGLNGLDDGQRVTFEVVKEKGKEAAANLKLA